MRCPLCRTADMPELVCKMFEGLQCVPCNGELHCFPFLTTCVLAVGAAVASYKRPMKLLFDTCNFYILTDNVWAVKRCNAVAE